MNRQSLLLLTLVGLTLASACASNPPPEAGPPPPAFPGAAPNPGGTPPHHRLAPRNRRRFPASR